MENIGNVTSRVTKLVTAISDPQIIKNEQLLCKPDCPICHGIGYLHNDLPVGDPRFGKLELCPNVSPLKLFGKKVGLTDKELNLSWGSMVDINGILRTIEKIKPFVEKGYGWIFLWGKPGLGKTTLLKIICAESIHLGRMAAFGRMADIIDDMRNAFSAENPSDEVSRTFKYWTERHVLCVDEFDRIRFTDYAAEREFTLLDRRYESALRHEGLTIMASNTDPSFFDAYLADRIYDSRFLVLHLDGISARPNVS